MKRWGLPETNQHQTWPHKNMQERQHHITLEEIVELIYPQEVDIPFLSFFFLNAL